MKILKKIALGLGMLPIGLVVLGLLIVVAPIIIVVVVWSGSQDYYTRLWSRIRHDPKRAMTIEGLGDDDWYEAGTKESFVEAFTKLSNGIARLAHAEQGEIQYDGFSVFDEPHPAHGWTNLSMTQTLRTPHAELHMSFDFGAFYNEGQQKMYVSADDDDCCAGMMPSVAITVVSPQLQVRRTFTTTSSLDVWMVIALLRGDTKFTLSGGQMWAYIPEHKVWLVQYKLNKSNYGLRAQFDNSVARKYARDIITEQTDRTRRSQ